MPVGDEDTATDAAAIYRLLPDQNSWTSRDIFIREAKSAGIAPERIAGLLYILHAYDLLRVREVDYDS